jgi:serine/threonine protein kinase
MGEVHLASDSRLERKVALKLLPENFRADPERRARFLREARAVAQLSHPNIAQIFEVGEVDGRDFLAFELVEGCTLEARLAERPLELAELVDIALPLADAIAYAHERGIVHRDLKAANVMITSRGHAKLLDFGLAKILDESSRSPQSKPSTTLTTEGAIFGTPGAMSPEQALGRPVDARSDVFSFGSLLYQMAAGRAAFRGATVMEVMDAVINHEPDPLGRVRGDLPAEFVACVTKALRKDPGERYQTMNDLAADLRHFKRATDSGLVPPARARTQQRFAIAAGIALALACGGWLAWRAGHPPSPVTSAAHVRRALAVLPFTNLAGSADEASFCAGLHSDVLTRLSKLGSLKVIARTSVLEYATTKKPLREIGTELGVDAILSGEVQRSGNALRFNLTLHDASSEDNLWAESYNRELTSASLFAVQSEIAEAVAHALQAQLSPAEQRVLRARPTTNDAAYEAYLLGKALQDSISLDDNERCRVALETAVALDSQFALAWVELSELRGGVYWNLDPTNDALLASAVDAAQRALAIDPDLPEGHLCLGQCHYYRRDYAGAAREYAIAEPNLPNSIKLLRLRGTLFRRTGKWDEALDSYTRARELSPRVGGAHYEVGVTALLMGRYDEALRCFENQTALNGEDVHLFIPVARVNRDGKLAPEMLANVMLPGRTVDVHSVLMRWRLRVFTRDLATARSELDVLPEWVSTQYHEYPRALLYALTDEMLGDSARAKPEYAAARDAARAYVQGRPTDARGHASLALALTGLGENEAALLEAREATELLPLDRDAVVGMMLVLDRFYVELHAGALDDAVRTLAAFLSRPAMFSLRALVLDPRLDALKGHAGFEALKRREGVQ